MGKHYIKVPKGTTVYSGLSGCSTVNPQVNENKPSTRDMVVELCWYASPTWQQQQAQMPNIVMWSRGTKYCLESDVELDVSAPVRKTSTPATPKITLRQRMVKGSKWKLTAPATVIKPGNPVTETNQKGNSWTTYSPVPNYDIPIGTEFEVTGKASTSIRFVSPGYCLFSGVWIPIKVAGAKTEILVEFKELNKNPDPVGVAVVEYMFVIQDKVSKKYYAGSDYQGYRQGTIAGSTDKLTKAKKFKRLADVRVHALIQSGYYDNLPESWGSVPEWMCGSKQFNIPKTWEIVKLNKITKEEIDRIELIDTFDRSWKLRTLTVKFNSAVRAVYSDLEKKGKLSEYSAMMMFGHERSKISHWIEELSEQEKDGINKVLTRFAGDAKICKTNTGFAVAVKDAMTTTMILLAYTGNLECVMIDFTTMEEIMQHKEAA